MKKVLFLSSALIMTMAGAYAADEIITGGPNTCTVDVLGVSADGATANTIATWLLNSYDCAAGQYLDETTLECIECPTGSYCPGGTFTVEANNSKTACPIDYTSDAAATAESECYMGCELACIQNACPENSQNCTYGTATSNGKQFYGQTACDATPQFCSMDFECNDGYTEITVTAEEIGRLSVLEPDDPETPDVLEENFVGVFACSWDGKGLAASNSWQEFPSICQVLQPGQVLYFTRNMEYAFLYEFIKSDHDGTDLPMTKCDNNGKCVSYNQNLVHEETGTNLWGRLTALMLPSADTEIIYGFSDGSINMPNNLTEQEQIEFVLGMASSEMATRIMANPELINNPTALLISSLKAVPFNNVWVSVGLSSNFSDFEYVAALGHYRIVSTLRQVLGYDYDDVEIFKEVLGEINYCKNNKININWNSDNGADNFQGMCYYDQGISLPSDPVKPGYTFTGWKLVETTTTE